MERRRLSTLIGLAMIAIGLFQAYLLAYNWVYASLGILYALLGVAYLWAEVYSTAQ